ncbi:MAG: DUF1273 family protein [Oscillospiraceae bacterium]|nr:DUF1273 family protein [Oscillospiraceae bacterium]
MGEFVSCSVTGHRPSRLPYKYNESHPDCAALKLAIARELERLRRQGVTDFYTGCAQGVDTWAGECVLEMMKIDGDIRLHCVVPFSGQDKKWPREHRERYGKLLTAASDIELVSGQYSDESYLKRNRVLADRADVMLAVLDKKKNAHSGTGYTVGYAQKNNKPIIVIDPLTLKVSKINFYEQLALI